MAIAATVTSSTIERRWRIRQLPDDGVVVGPPGAAFGLLRRARTDPASCRGVTLVPCPGASGSETARAATIARKPGGRPTCPLRRDTPPPAALMPVTDGLVATPCSTRPLRSFAVGTHWTQRSPTRKRLRLKNCSPWCSTKSCDVPTAFFTLSSSVNSTPYAGLSINLNWRSPSSVPT